ncbi:serine--tRNA ligase [Flexithrix dorotheae]|uniref:serine--tRNA ligase n=1 Tax=Flexithrix dorotheae TaxID=70993 RepID=UPI00037E3363|nr:serine--tRNA ligase [Flexithrix dorotheae]
MLQVQFIRDNKEKVILGLKKKYFANPEEAVEKVLETDKKRRELQVERDNVLAEGNRFSKEIGKLMKDGKREEAEEAKQKSASLKNKSKELNEEVTNLENNLIELLYQIPNIPHEEVPEGKTSDDNEIVFTVDDLPELKKEALSHWDLIEKYDIIDFNLGNKVTGAGFPYYKGKGAKLQRALINFFLEEAENAGYLEVQPPILINEASGYGTGQLPDKEGQMYKLEGTDAYLIPTAEVPITNMFRDTILKLDDLPIKIAGYTPCFRREAGSWGADVRGLNRLHQFDKVEIVHIVHPDNSYDVLLQMRNHIEMLIKKLELPYRILNLCGGDISFNAALCYDMEVYSAAQKRWLEVSSVSNFETYQANRLKLRFKDKNNKTQLAHTLNGSALALPRILAAILENNQTESGINIPKCLQKYTGFDLIS